jgi:hypothetical protein
MIYDYVIVGNNMNSLMLAYYLFKENNKVLIIDKKSFDDFYLYTSNNFVYKNPMYSNNDVNFLNFLNDIGINFRDTGTKININFDLIEKFKLNECGAIYIEFLNEIFNINESKNIKLKEKLNIFSDRTIENIKNICDFYNCDVNEISYYDFIQLINNCIINEFFNINDKTFIYYILKYFKINTNIDVMFETKFSKLDNKTINLETGENIDFTKKCIFCLSPKNINFIKENNKIKETTMYNYCWKINENILENNSNLYYKNENEIIFYSSEDKLNEIKTEHYFLNDKYTINIFKKYIFEDDINHKNYIIINEKKTIENNIIRNYNIINNLINKKKYRIYKNDSIVDMVKLILFVKIFIK